MLRPRCTPSLALWHQEATTRMTTATTDALLDETLAIHLFAGPGDTDEASDQEDLDDFDDDDLEDEEWDDEDDDEEWDDTEEEEEGEV
jgi:hypothetical protein